MVSNVPDVPSVGGGESLRTNLITVGGDGRKVQIEGFCEGIGGQKGSITGQRAKFRQGPGAARSINRKLLAFDRN